MKHPQDNVTRELGLSRAGRKPIGDRAMTPAERKARSVMAKKEAIHAQAMLAADSLRDALAALDAGEVESVREQLDLVRMFLADVMEINVPGSCPFEGEAIAACRGAA